MAFQCKSRRAQALVEWAVVFPVLMILFMGACQWAILQLQSNALHQAAFSAARARMVRENPFDAAAITMMPYAGWTDTLRGTLSEGSQDYDATLTSSSANAKSIPGWSTQPRSHLLPERLSLSVVEEDWEKVTMEATFNAELYFPMVESFFLQIHTANSKFHNIQVTGDTTVLAGFIDNRNFVSLDNVAFFPSNFVRLRARASVPRCDRPRSRDFIGESDPSYEEALYPESRDGLQTSGPRLYTLDPAVWEIQR